MAELIYPKLSYKIIGALFSVYNSLGAGYTEKYYQRAVAEALKKEGIKFSREIPVKLQFDGATIGHHHIDFLIEDKIVLELKRTRRLLPKDFKQVLMYLKSTNKRLGILANIGREELEYKRIVNRDFKG